MSTAQAEPWFTVEEYLRLDQVATERFEWVAGQVYAMAGGTDRHLATVQGFFGRVAPLARALGCRPWMTDRRLRTEHAVYYPDLFVVCGPRAGRLYEADATWVLEVLSPSTASTDVREKAAAYAALPGIQQYVIVDPDLRMTRIGVAEAAGEWSWTPYPADATLPVLNGEIDLADLWREVDDVAPD